MKVGVFGDSYVAKWHPAHKLATQVLDWKYATRFHSDNKPFIWWKHLEIIDPTLETFEHGAGGCDNWWIYSEFLDNHEKYDKVIVCITADSRYSWSTYEKGYRDYPEEKQNRHWLHATNIMTAEHKSEYYDGGQRLRDDYKVMVPYLERVYYSDRKRYVTFSRLLREEIKRIRPDTIFINCFNPTPVNGIDNDNSLYEITLYENAKLNKDLGIPTSMEDPALDSQIDCRIAHLTKPSHIQLAKRVANCILQNNTTVYLNVNEYHREMDEDDYKEFWTKRDMLKYANRYYDAGIPIG
tara:strand:+ start:279 stop:1166 length:888 start_codon:yes stop_codon:yes gene_type:complete